MKALLFAAALSISGMALAQDTSEPMANDQMSDPMTEPMQQPSGETVDDPSMSSGPQGQTQQGTDPNGEAMAPMGTNGKTGSRNMPMQHQGSMSPRSAAGNYPACSRTVTDSCVQSYEKGVRKPRRR